MALVKPTMQAIDWEPQMAKLEATLEAAQKEAKEIEAGLSEVSEELEEIDEVLEIEQAAFNLLEAIGQTDEA